MRGPTVYDGTYALIALGHLAVGSFDTYPNCIGRLAVHRQHDINFASPDQTARQSRVDLIEADEAALRADVKHLRIHTANRQRRSSQRADVSHSRAEQNQKHLIARRAEVNRYCDEAALRLIELRHRLGTLRAVLADTNRNGRRHSLPAGARGEKSGRDVSDLRRAD